MGQPDRRMQAGQVLGWALSCLLALAAYQLLTRADLQLWQGMRTHGDPSRRTMAFTFDDGPHPLWAPLLADTLEQHGACGTFFVVGREAELFPALIDRLARAGHQVASHSYTHPYPNLTALPTARVDAEIAQSVALLTKLTGQPVYNFRPPGGGVDEDVIRSARARGLDIAWWSLVVRDDRPCRPEAIVTALKDGARAGAVVLLHQRPYTVAGVARYFTEPVASRYAYVTYRVLMQD